MVVALLLLPFWLRRKNRRFGIVVAAVAADEFSTDAVSPEIRGTDADNAVPWVYVEPEGCWVELMGTRLPNIPRRFT
jgi:hypothetical protein